MKRVFSVTMTDAIISPNKTVLNVTKLIGLHRLNGITNFKIDAVGCKYKIATHSVSLI